MPNKKQLVRSAVVLVVGIFVFAGITYAYANIMKKTNGGQTKKSSAVTNGAASQVANISAAGENVSEASLDSSQQAQEQADQNISVSKGDNATQIAQYPLHRGISTTYFWAGEEAGSDNKNISNIPSAWDDLWGKHFGGVDDPNKRNGYMPAKFTPKENPFYFALPYNDFDGNGKRKKDANKIVPWASKKQWADNESMLKNQWIKIIKGNKTAYAQWQDVGPFGEDDSAYVFGNAKPKSKTNNNAGLDVSPAVHDMLGLSDVDSVDWQFVDESQVPSGPWKQIITKSQINWT